VCNMPDEAVGMAARVTPLVQPVYHCMAPGTNDLFPVINASSKSCIQGLAQLLTKKKLTHL
jgi:hypothetical protein